MTLEEQLKEFPEEFTLALERAKELQFPKVVNYGVEVFNIKDDVEKMSDEDFNSLVLFLRQIYNFGFYAGVSFTLDPESYIKNYSEDDKNEETK